MVKTITRRHFLSLSQACITHTSLALSIIAQPAIAKSEAAKKLTKLNFELFAPHFEIPDLNGTAYKTEDFEGKVLLISFWASWCPPCRKELPSLARLGKSMPGEKFAALAVNLGDTPASINNFLKKIDHQGLLILHAQNKNIMSEWHVQGLPSSYLIGPNGQIKYAVLGDLDWEHGEIRKTILQMTAEL